MLTRRLVAPVPMLALAGVVFLGCGSAETNTAAVSRPKPKPLTSEQLIAKVGPSTVKLFGRYGDSSVSGSGVVIDAEKGYVLTNAHVVSGVEALKAQVGDTTTTPARVVAQAPCDDVAVVELPEHPAGLEAMALGASGGVKAGQHVSVLGYPGTLEATDTGGSSKITFTDGTVSNPSTSAEIGANSPKYPALIQHQAPVNHGNSGGPLVDDFGRLIGLNTLTGAGSDAGNQTQGQYYAIAVDRITKALLPDLIAGHNIDDLGWTLEPVTTDLLYSFYDQQLADAVIEFLSNQSDTDGLIVLGTEPGSVAERRSFVLGDYITAINDTPVTSLADVCEIVQSKQPGSTLRVGGRLLSPDTPSDSFGDEFSQNMRVPPKE
jgi:S1-C subfamily serine protease